MWCFVEWRFDGYLARLCVYLFPIKIKFFLSTSIKVHVHSFGSTWYNGIIDDAVGKIVVKLNWCWTLDVAHSMFGIANGHNIFAVDETWSIFRFLNRGNGVITHPSNPHTYLMYLTPYNSIGGPKIPHIQPPPFQPPSLSTPSLHHVWRKYLSCFHGCCQ